MEGPRPPGERGRRRAPVRRLVVHQARRLGPGAAAAEVEKEDEGAGIPFTSRLLSHDPSLLLSVETPRLGRARQHESSCPWVRTSCTGGVDGAVVDRVGKIADVLDGGVLGLGQRVSVLLNLNREMDDAVVGETEEEDGPAPCADTLQDSRSGHLWTPPTPAPPGARGSLSWRTRRGGPLSSPSTPPARKLQGRSLAAGSRGRGGAPVQVR